MPTCKDCIHYDVCHYHIDEETTMTVNECGHFKDRTRFVELPCKVGDTVYEIQPDKTIYKWYVYGFTKYDGQSWAVKAKNNKNKWKYVDRTFDFSKFGKTVFLSRKEAEQALKECKNNG